MYITLIIIALISFIISQIIYVPYIRRTNGFIVSLYRSIFLSIILIPILYFSDFSVIGVENILYILFIGFIGAFGIIIQFESYKYLPIGIVSGFMNLYNVIILILGYYFYNEKLTLSGFIGATLIIVCGILIGIFKGGNKKLKKGYYKGIFLMILRIISHSIWVFCFIYFARKLNIYTIIYVSEFSVLIGFLPFIFYKFIYKKTEKFLIFSKKEVIKLFYITIFPAILSISMFLAVTYGDIGIVTLSVSSGSIFITIYGYIFFKEKLNIIQYISIIGTIIGLYIIFN